MQLTKTKLFLSSHSELVTLATRSNINATNKLGFYLPHVTLQHLIMTTLTTTTLSDSITAINNAVKITPAIRRNYYALFIRYGKEKSTINTIVEQLKINAIPDYKHCVESGLINESFKLDSLILDIAYPHQFDLTTVKLVENYKSYLFIEVADIYDKDIFTNIIEPFFKSIIDVIGFVGLKQDNATRLKQQYSKGGRSVLKYYNDTTTTPVRVTQHEASRVRKNSVNFSIYEKSKFSVGNTAWELTTTKRGIQKRKVEITKILDNNTYQVKNKLGFKFPISGDNLEAY